eukprot:scaffold297291_cov19-Prasinocladus_malaysianus.AAC.1
MKQCEVKPEAKRGGKGKGRKGKRKKGNEGKERTLAELRRGRRDGYIAGATYNVAHMSHQAKDT